MGQDNVYCNIEPPPTSLTSSFDTLIVHFYKGVVPWPEILNVEGFKLIYNVIKLEKEEEMLDTPPSEPTRTF
jgi:hypothetical protein